MTDAPNHGITSSDRPAGDGTRILLVEDHLIIQQALKLGLEQFGFTVVVDSGDDAARVMALAREDGVDVVLLDFYLEGGDSLPMIGPLVESGRRVIMLTGLEDRALLGRCLAAGADGIVQKAQALDALVRAVVDVTHGHTILRPAERDEMLRAAAAADAQAVARNAVFDALTSRERQVLTGLVLGKSAEQIANDEYVSLATVRSHIRSILTKLHVNSQLAAVAAARQAGWGS